MSGDRKWTTSLFDCFGDMSVCCLGFCCPVCMLCKNASDMGENSFCLTCCIPWPYSQLLIRSKIRTENGIQGDICRDYCTLCWCGWCAMCQEAREIKAVRDGEASVPEKSHRVVHQQPMTTVVTHQPAPAPQYIYGPNGERYVYADEMYPSGRR